ncbi:MAG: hypothetical protein AAF304_09045 [Pseudomonadota bacterium]
MTEETHIESYSISKKMRIFLLVATIVMLSITIYLMLKKPTPITPAALESEIQGIQKKLPIQVDNFTTLKNVTLEGMNIHYLFSVGSDPTQAPQFNAADENFAEQVEVAVKQNACINRNTRRYINSGVSLLYLYKNSNNETIADFSVPAGFCS